MDLILVVGKVVNLESQWCAWGVCYQWVYPIMFLCTLSKIFYLVWVPFPLLNCLYFKTFSSVPLISFYILMVIFQDPQWVGFLILKDTIFGSRAAWEDPGGLTKNWKILEGP